jgi:hypothetical protein
VKTEGKTKVERQIKEKSRQTKTAKRKYKDNKGKTEKKKN